MKTTIIDIAKKANVSTMTVSRVLNDESLVSKSTLQNVKRIMKELNYQPNLFAQSLSSRQSMIIGVVIPKTEKIFLDEYISSVLSGISDAAQKNNYKIILFPFNKSSDSTEDYISLIQNKLIDGIIILKEKIYDKFLPKLADSGFPFIVVNYKKHSPKYNFVDSENIKGAKLAIQYLYKKGHRKIGFITGDMNETNARDRMIGYKKALKQLNLSFRENYIIYGEFNQKKSYEETIKLLRLRDRPTAIFSSDDYSAIGAMERIKEEGLKIPDDIAIIGFDDIRLASYVNPPLTTIRQPMYEIGATASDSLIKLISKKIKVPIHKFLKVELIERGTV